MIVNPEAYGMLGDFGQRVVLTHETTHVATRAHTSAATPSGSPRASPTGPPTAARAHRPADRPRAGAGRGRGDLPAALPTDEDFGFGEDAAELARAYEGAWLACELIARMGRGGADRLLQGRGGAGAGRGRGAGLQEVLGTTPEDFTARWREYLRDRLG